MTDSIATLRELTSAGAWRGVVESFLSGSSPLLTGSEVFDTYWIEGGHRIREQVADDRLLSQFLHAVLPPYTGGAVALFRGENQDRFSAGLIGFSWTSDSKVASMFANGLNAVGSGAVLITATLDASAIISGPNAHSASLGEQHFTVDPFSATGIRSVAVFPAMQPNNSFKPKPLRGSA